MQSSEREQLRVVHVVRSLEIGGLEKVVADLAKCQGPKSVKIVCLTEIGAFGAKLRDRGFNVTEIGISRWTVNALVRLRTAIAKFEPQVIHCHNMQSLRFGGLAAQTIPNARLVFTKHGMVIPKSRFGGVVDRWIARKCEIVAVSRPIYRMMCDWSPRGASNVHFISNGLDLQPFEHQPSLLVARTALGLAAGDSVVGIVSRLATGKGHMTLLEAFRRVATRHSNARLAIVGDGPMRSEIEGRIAQLHLSSKVVMYGERNDIASLLPAFNVFVLPSISEGLPMTILEAMASRVPVIATSVGEIPSVIINGKSGMIVEPQNVEMLADGLELLLTNPEFADGLARTGRRRVEMEYASNRMALQYLDVYAGKNG